MTSNLGMPL